MVGLDQTRPDRDHAFVTVPTCINSSMEHYPDALTLMIDESKAQAIFQYILHCLVLIGA
jgi:hypothetical protein